MKKALLVTSILILSSLAVNKAYAGENCISKIRQNASTLSLELQRFDDHHQALCERGERWNEEDPESYQSPCSLGDPDSDAIENEALRRSNEFHLALQLIIENKPVRDQQQITTLNSVCSHNLSLVDALYGGSEKQNEAILSRTASIDYIGPNR